MSCMIVYYTSVALGRKLRGVFLSADYNKRT
jgi:hypothetical protein